ncbi:hypothetical protein IV203_000806 [Nitzschia inconspicua]|uniref:Uncharacterized protein n=1 Tax=Nitzschia inconspicua TaxID=303405 RepID=A0A9K3L5L9_9STRA|nr:hypothetical protein IV203_000806 [Nitzschia inconspicua]
MEGSTGDDEIAVPAVGNNLTAARKEDDSDGHNNVINNGGTGTILPQTFKVVGKLEEKRGTWKLFVIPTVLAISIAVLLSTVDDMEILQNHWFWICSGAVVALIVFETIQHSSRTGYSELVVIICPLGIQRITLRGERQQHNHPLLLTECIHDCILLEHVGAFSVSTHVMFRILKRKNDISSMHLVPAFPNAHLTFDQCLTLKDQLQMSIEEIR